MPQPQLGGGRGLMPGMPQAQQPQLNGFMRMPGRPQPQPQRGGGRGIRRMSQQTAFAPSTGTLPQPTTWSILMPPPPPPAVTPQGVKRPVDGDINPAPIKREKK